MKYLFFFIALAFSLNTEAQVKLNQFSMPRKAQTPPSKIVYLQNFVDGVKDWGVFNKGFIYQDGHEMGIINKEGGERGAILNGFLHKPDTKYTIHLNVKDVGNGLVVCKEWREPIAIIRSNGVHSIEYISNKERGVEGNRPVLVPLSFEPDTIKVTSFQIDESY